ncbi:hypothetical protein PUNSTDRAFT_133773 [Punctularia strigosozonata HHB-11173 SS5]|uniref:uncharacterized protein n=1 Tax=Punctularia strigosozonata (strain HHB-11173) TaxID=741275 RepID=UPI00044173BE|nr:uncharacterized protein PUNSTDRAFT_133773 [Punctularia strigosozonata HHB-11173 SS5]EIN10003.1 hypothetical protein PUNSTDRAFT_133773 [Punctularia strigosozonata HHB-11173 SS5]
MPPAKPYVVGPMRGAPYPAPAINIPNLMKQVENLTQRVEALEATLGYPSYQQSGPGTQWVQDVDGYPAALPAPMGMSSAWGGRVRMGRNEKTVA